MVSCSIHQPGNPEGFPWHWNERDLIKCQCSGTVLPVLPSPLNFRARGLRHKKAKLVVEQEDVVLVLDHEKSCHHCLTFL